MFKCHLRLEAYKHPRMGQGLGFKAVGMPTVTWKGFFTADSRPLDYNICN